MHSRIFQVSKQPIEKESEIDEFSLPEWFFESVADYVQSCSKDDALDWLKDCVGNGIDIKNDSIVVTEDINLYFLDKYNIMFQKALHDLIDCKVDDFGRNATHSNKVRLAIYRLKESYEDEYGFYIYNTDESHLMPLDKFLRECKVGTPYYVGGVLDYHY